MNGSTNSNYDKIFYTALGRERYVQMSKINLIINLNKTITVTFDANGGNCATTNKEVTYNSTYGMLPVAIKSGREFAGWYTSKSGGNQVTSASKVTELEDHILYARWKITVTFDANGGEFNVNGGTSNQLNQQVIEGNRYGTFPDSPTRTGYIFAGWYTAQTGGSNVTATTTVPDTGDHILYAHWTPALYMVTFDANGGTCTTSDKQVTYDSTYGTLPTPTRTGYTFDGWYTAATGGNKVTSSTQVTVTQNHTLYAHWTRATYIVTFNANGGSVSPTTKTVTVGSTYGDLPTPTREGYTFVGWFTGSAARDNSKPYKDYPWLYYADAYGDLFNAYGYNENSLQNHYKNWGKNEGRRTSQYISSDTVNLQGDITLYAGWSIDTYIISYNANNGSGAPSSQTKTYGVDLTLSSKAPTRSGYTFLGWGTSANATSASYQPGGKYTANSGTTLYAVWKLATVNVTSVTLNITTDQWIANNGSTLSLTATVAPSNATNKTVTWTSSNPSVATVSNGSVTAKGAGLTTITATAGGKSASVNVYVYNAKNNNYAHYVYTTTNNDSSKYYKANIKNGDLVVLQTVATSWHKIVYSTNSDIVGGYIWISTTGSAKNHYTTYNFNWNY